MSKLVLDNVTKSFLANGRRVVAANNVNVSLSDELLVIVGPSGSGKTTLLRIIAGLEQADAGTISIDGAIINHLLPRERNVAMVFQTPALFPHLSVFDNIAFGLKLRKVARQEIEQRVSGAAEKFGITSKLQCRPDELSGGEAQRVALARATVREPKSFLLDEPLSSLDPPTRKQLRREIICLRERLAVPMIYVTHDQREALTLGQKILVMKAGEVQQVGTPDQIQAAPANDFVAEFFDLTA